MARLSFVVGEALRALRRSAAPSTAAAVTIVVTVVLLGVLIPVVFATRGTNEEVRGQIAHVEVYLFDDATSKEIAEFEREINAIPHVTGTEFISKKRALAILEETLNDDDILAELPGNPLPRSFIISLDDPDNLEAVRGALVPAGESGGPQPLNPIVADVNDPQTAEDIRAVTGAVQIVLGVITALLLFASVLLVGNTIRLSIYARRREVEVMRLVGATNWFIRWPFVLEGMIVGLVGAAAAVAILLLGKVTIVDPLADRFALVEAQQGSIDFGLLIVVLVVSAMLVSAIGSGLTLRRFLRV